MRKQYTKSIFETRAKVREVELSGESYMRKEKDSILFDTIRLLTEENSLFCIPKVKNQYEDLPEYFSAKIVSDKELVFENPAHDFPQINPCTQINAGSLVAEVSGTKNEKEQKFPTKRVK